MTAKSAARRLFTSVPRPVKAWLKTFALLFLSLCLYTVGVIACALVIITLAMLVSTVFGPALAGIFAITSLLAVVAAALAFIVKF